MVLEMKVLPRRDGVYCPLVVKVTVKERKVQDLIVEGQDLGQVPGLHLGHVQGQGQAVDQDLVHVQGQGQGPGLDQGQGRGRGRDLVQGRGAGVHVHALAVEADLAVEVGQGQEADQDQGHGVDQDQGQGQGRGPQLDLEEDQHRVVLLGVHVPDQVVGVQQGPGMKVIEGSKRGLTLYEENVYSFIFTTGIRCIAM